MVTIPFIKLMLYTNSFDIWGYAEHDFSKSYCILVILERHVIFCYLSVVFFFFTILTAQSKCVYHGHRHINILWYRLIADRNDRGRSLLEKYEVLFTNLPGGGGGKLMQSNTKTKYRTYSKNPSNCALYVWPQWKILVVYLKN